MSIRVWILSMAAVGIAGFTSARGERHLEDFSSGSVSADAGLQYELGSWSFTGGVARVTMDETLPYAYPDTASLSPRATAFTGNWADAGIELVGFKFMAGSPSPSHLYLDLFAGDNFHFRKIFPVPAPGEWTTLMVSVLSADAGEWVAIEGDDGDFEHALRNVQRVTLQIQRAGAMAVDHLVDDFFLDRLPRQVDARITSGSVQFSLDALQVGVPYNLQASFAPTGQWFDVQALAATNRNGLLEVPLDADAQAKFFRLKAE